MARRAQVENYSLDSVARAASVLEALEQLGRCSLDQVAGATGLSESTALRYLLSLANCDLVERDTATGTYRLGLALFRLGESAIRQRDIYSAASPVAEKLLQRFGERLNLAARQGDQVMILRVWESPAPVRKGLPAGGIDSWHATSLGKSILAGLEDSEVLEIVRSIQLTPFTPHTLETEDDLLVNIQDIRTNGYAIDDEESEEGLRCVGAAIRDHTSAPAYALSVSGPKSRMSHSRLREIGSVLADEVGRISQDLGLRHE
jgi:IclR family acetate operon transcriptional repressor